MLWVGKQHSDEHNVDDNEKCMEAIAPVAMDMIVSGGGTVILDIIAKKGWWTQGQYLYNGTTQ